MKIKRKIGSERKELVEIELTEEEIEAAYREKERQYRMMDIEAHVRDMGSDDLSGLNPEDIINTAGLMDSIYERFMARSDCNIPENDMMEAVIRDVIKERERKINASMNLRQ